MNSPILPITLATFLSIFTRCQAQTPPPPEPASPTTQDPVAVTTPAQSPEIAALSAQYKAEVERIKVARQAAVKVVADRYIRGLDGAEKQATAKSAFAVVAAIVRERGEVSKDTQMSAQAEAEVPRDLISQRTQFITDKAAVEKAVAAKMQGLCVGQLRSLAALEVRAKQTNNSALLQQITDEKLKIADEMKNSPQATAAAPANGKHGLVNGDFSASDANGSPQGWTATNAQVIHEGPLSFVRISDGRLDQVVTVPRGARSIRISAKVRSPDLAPFPNVLGASAGVGVYFDIPPSASGYSSSQGVAFALIREKTRIWKTVNEQSKIAEGTQKLRVLVHRWSCAAGTVDVDDIQIHFD